MRCEDMMKKDSVFVSTDETARTAAELMRAGNIGFLPVCDEQSRVVGAITDRDLAMRIVADGLDANTSIADVMTNEVISCKPNDDVDQARELMETYHKSRIVLTDDDGILRGVISLSDFAAYGPELEAGETLREISKRESRPS